MKNIRSTGFTRRLHAQVLHKLNQNLQITKIQVNRLVDSEKISTTLTAQSHGVVTFLPETAKPALKEISP